VDITVQVGGLYSGPINYAGAQGDFAGLDQINARLSRSLIGRGEVSVVLTVDGKGANPVTIHLK
jgi:uncharacterized protein (TIGR03437 family)